MKVKFITLFSIAFISLSVNAQTYVPFNYSPKFIGSEIVTGSLAVGQTSGSDASAVVEFESTTKGFLVPRMTQTQRDAISSPSTGLMVYNSDNNAFNWYNGSGWSAVGTGSGTVTSVSGTSNRITSSGGATPVIDISASYVGQTSITTLGTIGAGTWQGSLIAVGFGGTGTSTTFTQGSVVFSGASGIYTQDNSGIFFNSTDNFLGVGTAVPTSPLHLIKTSVDVDITGLLSNITVTNTSDAGRVYNGASLMITKTDNVNETTGEIYGGIAQSIITGNGNIANQVAFDANALLQNNGAITQPSSIGLSGYVENASAHASAAITDAIGVVGAVVNSGSGSITTSYAFKVGASEGTTSYGFYNSITGALNSFNKTLFTEDIQFTTKGINTTAGDAATINSPTGRFRKDATGSAFTLTNSFITANSIILLTSTTTGITSGYQLSVAAGTGSAVITFETNGVAAAPNTNMDINFLIIN